MYAGRQGFGSILWSGAVHSVAACKGACEEHTGCAAISYHEGGTHPEHYCHLHSTFVGQYGSPMDDPWNFYAMDCDTSGAALNGLVWYMWALVYFSVASAVVAI